jgi:hypothetical protein
MLLDQWADITTFNTDNLFPFHRFCIRVANRLSLIICFKIIVFNALHPLEINVESIIKYCKKGHALLGCDSCKNN